MSNVPMMNMKGNDLEAGHSPSATSVNSSPDRQRPSRIANPNPVALISFASTTLILSLYNINTGGVHTPNVIVGMAIFSGGLLQFLAGMWQFPRGDVYGASASSSYGAFWMSYAAIFIPGSGVISSYANPQEFANALGIYLMTWYVVTLIFILPTIRRTFTSTLLFSSLSFVFLFLALGQFTGKTSLIKAGGVAGIVTVSSGYYIAVSELLAAEARPLVMLPQGIWPS